VSKLEQDTRLQRHGELAVFDASLSEDWSIWLPNGGYLAAIALRAASEISERTSPACVHCQFLNAPKPATVRVAASHLKTTRATDALQVVMTQDEKPILQAQVWMVDALEGYTHDQARIPDVPDVDSLQSTLDIDGGLAPHAFWRNIEQRPTTGDLHWQQPESGKAIQCDWIRFLPDIVDPSPVLRAARHIILLDTFGWPAAARAHCGDSQFIAPTLSLNVTFHRDSNSSWLLSEARAPIAEGGRIFTDNRVWSEDLQLLASGSAMLICRPRPG